MPPVLVGLFRQITVPAPSPSRIPLLETETFIFLSGYNCTLSIPSLSPTRRIATYIQSIICTSSNEIEFQITTDEFGGITITDRSIGNAWRRMNNTLCDKLPETNKLKHVCQRIGPFVGPLLFGLCIPEIREMLEFVVAPTKLIKYQSQPLELTRYIMTEYLAEAERMPIPALSNDAISFICNMTPNDIERSGLAFLKWIWDCHATNHISLPHTSLTSRVLVMQMAGNDETIATATPDNIKKPSSDVFFPIILSSTLKVLKPGVVLQGRPEFCINGICYPLGFTSIKTFKSSKKGVETAEYQNEIAETVDGTPLFIVTALDGSGLTSQNLSTRGAWESIRSQIHARLNPHTPQPAMCVKGDEMFGLAHPVIQRLLSLLKYETDVRSKKERFAKRNRKEEEYIPPIKPNKPIISTLGNLPPPPQGFGSSSQSPRNAPTLFTRLNGQISPTESPYYRSVNSSFASSPPTQSSSQSPNQYSFYSNPFSPVTLTACSPPVEETLRPLTAQ